MAEGGGERTLIKIAVFCIAVSIISTCMIALYKQGSSDYDYDTINAYRSELIEFSGGQLVNDNPWVLSAVYTPFIPGSVDEQDIPDHIERDNGQSIGWLFGESVAYSYIDKVANIKLDPAQKSNQLLTFGDPFDYEYRNGTSWWNSAEEGGVTLLNPNLVRWLSEKSGIGNIDQNYGYETTTGTANNWNYTGYRYVFDPVLPFSNEGSAKDGRLSIVWYQIPTDTGLSGALEVYGGSGQNQIKLGTISASKVIEAFRSSVGYVQVFDFNFEGTHLNLTIQFDPTVYNSYSNLQQAWDAGAWSMAISSASAGNFFDIDNSNSFNVTAGSMLDTFVQIYTFDYPEFDGWLGVIMWLLVGLPMTLAMLFITMRLVGGVFKIF